MKRIILFCLVIIFPVISLTAWSQTGKGKFLLGGQFDLNFSSVTMPDIPNSSTGSKTRIIGIAPQLGYFILDNLPVGLEALYNSKKSTDDAGYKFSRTLSVVPFIRYYIGKGKIKPYIHAGIGPGISKTGSKSGNFPELTQSSKLLTREIRGGFEILVNKSVGFDFGFGYNSTTTYYKEPMVNGTFDEWKNVSKGTAGSIAVVIYL
jgi:hypothetical protein